MRIAVVGATGNAGTAVLRALGRREEIDSVVGIARRMPETDREPYAEAEWVSIDIAAASTEDDAEDQLTRAFRGADAVIHLAWLIQPNTERELLRRVNVEGTRRVAEAAVAAGVGQLVVASSVGAYSPCRDTELHDESWPVGGIEGSHYSVDKADQEQVLDDVAARHPELILTRIRPALIFQAEAGAEIQRYFLGRRLPVQLLGLAKPPAMPLPAGLHVQAVHADDVAEAYAAAVVTRAPGAFNICADDVLDTRQLAEIIDGGRVLPLPRSVVRTAMAGAYRTGLIPADGGWLDMAYGVPLMDNSRARRVLGWAPQHSAAEAVRVLLGGMIDGRGTDSIPLRPRGETGRGPEIDQALAGSADRAQRDDHGQIRPVRISPQIDQDLLNLYLSDHLSGAEAGTQRIERMAETYIDTPVYTPLAELAAEIRAEHDLLAELLPALGLKRMRSRQIVAAVGERLGRLKLNGRIITRSPLSLLLETELARSAVSGKLGVWQSLHDNAEQLGLDAAFFAQRVEAALAQIERIDRIHDFVAPRAFRTDRQSFPPEGEDAEPGAARQGHQQQDPSATSPSPAQEETQS